MLKASTLHNDSDQWSLVICTMFPHNYSGVAALPYTMFGNSRYQHLKVQALPVILGLRGSQSCPESQTLAMLLGVFDKLYKGRWPFHIWYWVMLSHKYNLSAFKTQLVPLRIWLITIGEPWIWIDQLIVVHIVQGPSWSTNSSLITLFKIPDWSL